jgi:tRNA-dihydrouridine synthase
LELTNASGLMIGRAAIGRPDIFAQIKVGLGWMDEADLPWVQELKDDWENLSETSKAFASRRWCWDRYVALCRETTGLAKQTMQRHAIAFSKGLPGAKSVRTLMHELSDVNESAQAISDFLKPVSEG